LPSPRSFAIVSFAVVAIACGSSAGEKTADAPFVVAGFFEAKAGAENVAIREIEFDDIHYRLRSASCAEARCDEQGTFTYDRANKRLDLRVDPSGKTYSLPFEARAAAQPTALTTSSVEEPPPALTEPGQQVVEQGENPLLVTSVLLNGTEYNLVSAESSASKPRCKPSCTTAAKRCVQGCVQRKSTCACWGMCADDFYRCNNYDYDCSFPSGGAC
jgi:hypothetical protein